MPVAKMIQLLGLTMMMIIRLTTLVMRKKWMKIDDVSDRLHLESERLTVTSRLHSISTEINPNQTNNKIQYNNL